MPYAFLLFLTVLFLGMFDRTHAQAGLYPKLDQYLNGLILPEEGFRSGEEKLLFLTEHLHDSNLYYALAKDLSALPRKSPELRAALHKKVLQCLLHQQTYRQQYFQGILMGLMENDAYAKQDLAPFLEAVAADDSKWRDSSYLASIALGPVANSGLLFSVPEKLRILAYKYLLAIQPGHSGAISFFRDYPKKPNGQPFRYCFIARDNEWSGTGLVNELGEWLLPPFYSFGDGQAVFRDSIALFRLDGYQLQEYNNWIDRQGRILAPGFVSGAGPFIAGKAQYKDGSTIRFLDKKGKTIDLPESQSLRFLPNGYSYFTEKDSVIVTDDTGKRLVARNKKYRYLILHEQDGLISYGSTAGYPGSGAYGYMNLKGQILTEPLFATSSDWGYSTNNFGQWDVMSLPLEGHKVGLVNRKFETLIPFEYDYILVVNRKFVIAKKGPSYYLFDHSGKQLQQPVPEAFTGYGTRYSGSFGIWFGKDFRRLVDEDGQLVKGLENVPAGETQNGFYILKKELWGVVDNQMKDVVPPFYDEIIFVSDHVILVKKDGRFQTIDIKTGDIFALPYCLGENAERKWYKESLIVFKVNGKSGVVGTDGALVLPFLYHEVLLP